MKQRRLVQRVALCIPTYKRPLLLARLVADLSRQTLLPDLLIVVDGDPSSGEVKGILKELARSLPLEIAYVPANRANLAYQRYLGWLFAKEKDAEFLLYVDDDLRIEQPDAVEKVLLPFVLDERVVGVTARIQYSRKAERLRDAPVLEERTRPRGPLMALLVRVFGSKTPPGGLTPSGHRRVPNENGDCYAPVRWLFGGVMAYRMTALTQECFSADLFALTHVQCGMGEDTLLSHRVSTKGKMLMACGATFLHPNDDLPNAYPVKAFHLAHAIAYSRRLLNDDYRYPASATASDRLALVRGYVGNMLSLWCRACFRPTSHRVAYAWGYTVGAIRGLMWAPRTQRLTPGIDWWEEAKESVRLAVTISRDS